MIEIRNLTKQFLNETVIRYQDLVFEDGKSYILLGASGCGKSTLLNMIAGVLSPTSGEILIDGVSMKEKTQKEKDLFRIKNIGYIFQDFKLIEEMTAFDNIDILRLEGIKTAGAGVLLRKLGVPGNKKIKHLSGGQKQRVAVVRALIKEPAIILADEPTGNLNFEMGKTVVKELTEISKGKRLSRSHTMTA